MRYFFVSLLFTLLAAKFCFGTTYFVSFKYKRSLGYTLTQPDRYLSSKSIYRRTVQKIALDSTDLPVDSHYISEIGAHVLKVVYASKWLNGVLVEATTEQANMLFVNPIVKDVKVAYVLLPNSIGQKFEDPIDIGDPGESVGNLYGESYEQVKLVNGQWLHQQNLFGEGKVIAVIDAGFDGYESLPAFSTLKNNVVDSFDFMMHASLLRSSDAHGTKILSLLGGAMEGKFYGAATKAKYALYVAESNMFEQIVEEYAWCFAAERADSIGCDIISSSLGYNKFDVATMNHSISDLGKGIVPISVAAELASKKGILTVISAGNEGNKVWKYTTFPADSPSVVAVGAVTNAGKLGVFSSVGFPDSSKPDVVCMGVAATVIDNNGNIVRGNGTSYAAPQIAGFAACLWDAYPTASASDIKAAIVQSASQSSAPNNLLGSGIPDFGKAGAILKVKYPSNEKELNVFPNPFTSYISVAVPENYTGAAHYYIYDLTGRLIRGGVSNFVAGSARIDGLDTLNEGLVIFRLIFDGGNSSAKLIKITN